MSSSNLSVLLTTEGTYPFYGGGVSTWCDRLTHGLGEVDYTLFSLTTDPFTALRYILAPNVRKVVRAPQWGLIQPAEYQDMSLSRFLRHRWRTKPQVIERTFQPLFEHFLRLVSRVTPDLPHLGEVLLSLHLFFRTHDYALTMNSPTAWNTFRDVCTSRQQVHPDHIARPTLAELKQAFRLLYHFLTVLHVDVPETNLVHSSAAAFCGIPCVLAKLLRGTPYLLTEHGVYLREQYLNLRGQIRSPFVRWFLLRLSGAVARLSYHFADQVAPVCAYNARWERKLGVAPNRLKVIFNGVDQERYSRTQPEVKTRPRISTVGLIYPLKGQVDLIKAAAQVRDQVPNVDIRIYGAATDKAYQARCDGLVAEYRLQDTVTFAGLTKEPWKVYSDADVFVLPSVSEGFPYVVVEAMMCGAAIVATDVGGVREALGPAGILTPSRNPESLAQALTWMLQHDSERKRLGGMAQARALDLFTEKRFFENYLDAYWDLYLGVRSTALQLTA